MDLIPRWKSGILRVLMFLVLYLFLLIFLLILIERMIAENIVLSLLLQIGIQCVFMSGSAFLVVVISASISWAITICLSYHFFQVILQGALLPQVYILLFNDRILAPTEVLKYSLSTFLTGVSFFICAHFWFKYKY